LLHVKGSIAQYERAKIRERTLRGKRQKARSGRVPAGPIAYGYRSDPTQPGRLVAHEGEAAVVQMMFGWLVDEGRAVRWIVTELGRLGILAARGRMWAKSSVRRLLTSELYAGRAWFDRRQRKGNTLQLRQRSEWIPIRVPAIVSEAVFQCAQE